jgi:hypothetical protein
MRSITVLPVFLLAACAWAADPDFDSHWRDGKAELNGYRLDVSRYAEKRKGQAVLIYVTEPFSESKRVKVDDWTKDPADTFDAFKLNLVRDFQTGLYDYNTMVSVFVRAKDFSPVKVTLTSAEWCGHVYEELIFRPAGITGHSYSYFEGESGPRTLTHNPDGLLEDNLWIQLRGLRGAFLKPGEKKSFPFLPGRLHDRLAHRLPAWTTAEIARSEQPQTIEVPAGKFEVTVYALQIAGGRAGRFFVEQAYPHRIIRWELAPDVTAELTGSARLEYWRLQNNGDENELKLLGIKPPAE